MFFHTTVSTASCTVEQNASDSIRLCLATICTLLDVTGRLQDERRLRGQVRLRLKLQKDIKQTGAMAHFSHK